MTVEDLITVLEAIDGTLPVVKTNKDGKHEEITHVDVEIGLGYIVVAIDNQ